MDFGGVSDNNLSVLGVSRDKGQVPRVDTATYSVQVPKVHADNVALRILPKG